MLSRLKYIVYQDTQFKCQRNYHRHSDTNSFLSAYALQVCAARVCSG